MRRLFEKEHQGAVGVFTYVGGGGKGYLGTRKLHYAPMRTRYEGCGSAEKKEERKEEDARARPPPRERGGGGEKE